MSTVVVAARLGLAAVLVMASVSKVVDLGAFGEANRRLGVPERVVGAARVGVPATELLLAVGLLVTPVASGAAAGTGLLFLAFTGLLVWNLAQGRRPSCNCFGSVRDEPISWWSVARNALLIVLAALALGAGHDGLPAWFSSRTDAAGLGRAVAVLAAALVLVSGASAALLRSGWRIEPRGRTGDRGSEGVGMPVGTDVGDLFARVRAGTGWPEELPVLVVRTDPECGPCLALIPRLISWQRTYAGILDVVVLTTDEAGSEHGDEFANVIAGGESIWEHLRLDVTPSAVVIGPDGRIASGVAAGAIEIGALVTDVMQDDATPHLVQGDPAGGVVLPLSGGGMISVADLLGTVTLLLFWDPWCGFCRQALLALLQWQDGLDPTRQSLLMACQRDDEVGQLQAFRLVGADPDGAVMQLFGGEGTPSAVLIDAAGRVASEIAHGQDEVLALAARSDLLASLAAPAQ